MQPLKRLLSETALYGLSSVVGRILHYLLLVPFHTSIFSPAEYGTITEWYAYIAFLQVLYSYGMETAYFRFAKEYPKALDLAISTLIISTCLFSGLLVLGATPITHLIARPGQERFIYYLAAILTVDTMLAVPFASLRLQNRAFLFAFAKLLQIGMTIILNLFLLYVCTHIHADQWLPGLQYWINSWYDPAKKMEYVLLANFLANITALPLLGLSLPRIRLQYTWAQLRPMLGYALPLMLTGLAATTNEMFSRMMLRHWLPPHLYPGQTNEAVLGVFGACYKLAVFMLLAIQAFRYAAEPFFFTHAKKHYAPQLFSAVLHGFVLVACFILFAVSINIKLLGHLLLGRADYAAGLPIVPYLLLAYLLLGVYYNLSVWFRLADKTHYSALLMSLGAFVTLGLNRLLIPMLGYWGSVWATIASYATMGALCYYWGQRHYPVPYRVGRELLYVMATWTSIWFVSLLPYGTWTQAVIGNLALTCLAGMLLGQLGYQTYIDYELTIKNKPSPPI